MTRYWDEHQPAHIRLEQVLLSLGAIEKPTNKTAAPLDSQSPENIEAIRKLMQSMPQGI